MTAVETTTASRATPGSLNSPLSRADTLAALMKEHVLTQKDLPEMES
jgi:hypothetical protein